MELATEVHHLQLPVLAVGAAVLGLLVAQETAQELAALEVLAFAQPLQGSVFSMLVEVVEVVVLPLVLAAPVVEMAA